MSNKMKTALDGVLQQCAGRFGGAPGVVAMATDRNTNIYEGAAGVRELGKDTAMTTTRRCPPAYTRQPAAAPP